VSEIVTNAVVIKVGVGRECLVAFLECSSTEEFHDTVIIPSGSLGFLFTSLRHAVHQKLPGYVAPANYVAVNRFPLTTSGKLDCTIFVPFFTYTSSLFEIWKEHQMPLTFMLCQGQKFKR
jgi:hypothetical protein